MKQYFGPGLAMLAGTMIGAAGISVLHAQAKPPVYLVTESPSGKFGFMARHFQQVA